MSIIDKNNASKIENKPLVYTVVDWARRGGRKDKIVALRRNWEITR